MKIKKYNNHPPVGAKQQELYWKIIEEFSATIGRTKEGFLDFEYNNETRNFIIQFVDGWIPFPFEYMTHLMDWAELLNCFDTVLEKILSKWKSQLILVENVDGTSENGPNGLDDDVMCLKSVLKFTSALLKQTINKDVYNSTEHVVELLRAYDDDLLLLALQVLDALSMQPLNHRCDLDVSRHSTALHKNPVYLQPLFELVESSCFPSNSGVMAVGNFLAPTFQTLEELRAIRIDSNSRLKFCKVGSTAAAEETDTLAQATNNDFEIADFLVEDRSIQDILRTSGQNISFSSKFYVMCALRFKRLLVSLEGRRLYVRMQYMAAGVLLLCHTDSSVLYNFFQDKVDMIKDFIYLLSTAPNLSESESGAATAVAMGAAIPADIRILSCKCLEAIIGSRDSSASPIFIRYPWILHDLGVTRGQYMGLFPCLLRATSSFLASACCPVDGASRPQETEQDKAAFAEKLSWCEHFFTLLLALVNSTAAMQALTENGLVSSILSIVRSPLEAEGEGEAADLPAPVRAIPTFVYIEILATEVLESVATNHPPAQTVFKELHGPEIVLNRLAYEVTREVQASQARSGADPYCLTNHNNIMIQELFSILQSFNQDNGHESAYSDSRANGQLLYRNPDLNKALSDIFQHPQLFTAQIVSPAITLVQEIINSDPSPPTIQAHFVSGGLAGKALRSFECLRGGGLDCDAVTALFGLASAVALTEEGLKMLTAANPFQFIFEMFHQRELFSPQARAGNADLPGVVGSNLEELIRHYPSLRNLCMDGILAELDLILSLPRGDVDISAGMSPEYLDILCFATAAVTCLELLLQKKWPVTEFLSRGGYEILLKCLKLALGPPRFTIISLACGVDPTFPVGYFPLSSAVNRCLAQMIEFEAKMVLKYISVELSTYVRDFNASVAAYWEAATAASSSGASKSVLGIINSLPRDSIQNIQPSDPASSLLVPYSNVLQAISVLGFAVESFGISVSPMKLPGAKLDKACLDTLTNEAFISGLHSMVTTVFVPIVEELSKTPAVTIGGDSLLAHPVYHILVTAMDHVVVRDSSEDYAKKVGKVPRGAKVLAYERKATSPVHVKYRVDDGWISVYKNGSPEPQLQVLDVLAKSLEHVQAEHAKNKAALSTHRQKCEFEMWSKISPVKGCVWALQQFYLTVKVHIFAALARNVSLAVQSNHSTFASEGYAAQSTSFSATVLPMFMNTIDQVATMAMPANMAFSPLKPIAEALALAKIDSFQSMSREQIREHLCEQSASLAAPYFTLENINTAIRLVEICNALIFETRRGKSEPINHVVLIFLSANKHMFEKLLQISVVIFFSCFDSPPQSDLTLTLTLSDASTAADERKEKRDICLCAVENVIEFWKHLYMLISQPITGTEKILSKDHSHYSHYDPVTFKRHNLVLLSRYLAQIFFCPQLYTLPAQTVRSCLDVLFVIMKSLHDAKKMPMLTYPPTETKDSQAPPIFGFGRTNEPRIGRRTNAFSFGYAPSSVSYSSSAHPAPEFHAFAGPRGAPDGPAPIAGATATVAVRESTLQRLEEMGFSRRTVARAVRNLRTNDVTQLVSYLLENPFLAMEVDDPAADSAAAPAPAAAADPAAAPSSAPAAAASDAPENAAAGAGPLASQEASSASDSAGSEAIVGAAAALPAASSSSSSIDPAPTSPKPSSQLLPVFTVKSDSELHIDKDFIVFFPACLCDSLPALLVQLIEFGDVASKETAQGDAGPVPAPAAKQQGPRDVHTLIVLNQVLKCLDKFKESSSNFMFALQLSWLYNRANQLLDVEQPAPDHYVRLFGILHAIVILLVSSSHKTAQVKASHGHELIYLIFCLDSNYSCLHAKLIRHLAEQRAVIFDPARNQDGEGIGEGDSVSWVSPALLILDFFAQPLLVDQQMLLTSLTDFGTYKKCELNSGEGFDYRRVLSPTVEKTICEMYSLKKSRSQTADGSEPGLYPADGGSQTALAEKEASSVVEKVELPLFEKGLLPEQRISCVQICGSILSLLNQRSLGNAAKYCVLCHACLQLLVHLTRSNVARDEFHSMDGISTVLRCAVYFDGLPKFVYSVVQQMLEDPAYLSLSMSTAIRLCLSKLSKHPEKASKSGRVSFKALVEAITPLLYRDQQLALRILQDSIEFQLENGQVFVRYVEKGKAPQPLLPPPQPQPQAQDSGGSDSSSAAGSKRQRAANAPAAAESSSAPALAPADEAEPSIDTPRTKKQRVVVSESSTSASSSSSSDSSALAVASPASALPAEGASSIDLHLQASPGMQDVVEEIVSQIVVKWIMIMEIKKYADRDDQSALVSALQELRQVPMSSMSIANLLVVLSDLVSSLPALAITVLRFQFKKMKLFRFLEGIAGSTTKCVPIKHAFTGEPLASTSFTSFVVHSLLLPQVTASNTKAKAKEKGDSDEDRDRDGGPDSKSIPDCDKIAGLDIKDSCCYLIAALASRQGDGRKRVLGELVGCLDVGASRLDSYEVLKAAITFSQALQSLITPPAKWLERDSFIIPSKDFLVALVKLNAHEAISNILCAIGLEHPLSLEASNMLIVPLEMLMRKNVSAAADESRSGRFERARRTGLSFCRHHHHHPRSSSRGGSGSGGDGGSSSAGSSREPSQPQPQPQPDAEPAAAASSEMLEDQALHERSTSASIPVHPESTSTGGGVAQSAGGDGGEPNAAEMSVLSQQDADEHGGLYDQHDHLLRQDESVNLDQYSSDEEHGAHLMDDAEDDMGGDEEEDIDDDEDDEDDDDDEDDGDGDGDGEEDIRDMDDDAEAADDEGDDEEGDDGVHGREMHGGNDDDEEDEEDEDDHDDANEDDDDDHGLHEVHDDDEDDEEEHDHPSEEDLEGEGEEDEEEEDGEEDAAMDEDEVDDLDAAVNRLDAMFASEEADAAAQSFSSSSSAPSSSSAADAVAGPAQSSAADGDRDRAVNFDDGEEEEEEDDEEDEDEDEDNDIDEGEDIIIDRIDDDGSQNDFDQASLVDAAFRDGMDEGEGFEMERERASHGSAPSLDEDDGPDDEFAHDHHDMWGPHIRVGHIRRASHGGPAGGASVRRSVRIRQSDLLEAMEMSGRGSHMGISVPGGGRAFQVRIEGGSSMPSMIDLVRGAAMSSGAGMEMHGPAGSAFGSSMGGPGGFGSFHHFVSSIMPSSIGSSATARLDHRTGNLTLSIGSGQEFSPQESADIFHHRGHAHMATSGGGGGASSTTPPVHPLVMITAEARPQRLYTHSSAGSNVTAYTSRTVGSNMIATLVTNMRDPLGLQSVDHRRQIRLGMGPTPPTPSTIIRRKVGPIVSDRRWGTDVGEIEPVGSRQSILFTAVENAMNQVIPSRQRDASASAKPLRSADRSHHRPSPHYVPQSMYRALLAPDAGSSDEDQNFFSIFEGGAQNQESDDEEGPDGVDRMEESKEEGELQESKDGDDGANMGTAAVAVSGDAASSASAPAVAVAVAASAAAVVPPAAPIEYDSMDHLLDTIGFAGQCDDGSGSAMDAVDEFSFREPMLLAVGGSAAASAEVAVEAAPAVAQEGQGERDGEQQQGVMDAEPAAAAQSAESQVQTAAALLPESQSSATVPQEAASTAAAAPAASPSRPSSSVSVSASVSVVNENLQFVESLSGDLRQEVLLSSNEEFLSTLPQRIQDEARRLRENRVRGFGMGMGMEDAITAEDLMMFAEFSDSILGGPGRLPHPSSHPLSAIYRSRDELFSALSEAVAAPTPLHRRMDLPSLGVPAIEAAATAASQEQPTSSSSSSSSSSSAATAAAAAAAKSSEAIQSAERHCTDLADTLSQASYDLVDGGAPYDATLIVKLLRCFINTKKSKLPRSMLRFVSTACRFKRGRGQLLRALFASFTSESGAPDAAILRRSVEEMHDGFRAGPAEDGKGEAAEGGRHTVPAAASTDRLQSELSRLCQELAVSSSNPTHLRKLLTGLNYIVRKTSKIVWFEIMSRQAGDGDGGGGGGGLCLFDSLLSLLSRRENNASMSLELIMMVVEELCNPYGNLTVQEATYLSTQAPKSVVPEEEVEPRAHKEPHPRKKLRISDVLEIIRDTSGSRDEGGVPSADTSSSSTAAPVAAPAAEEMQSDEQGGKKAKLEGILLYTKRAKVPYPFVALRARESRLLCEVVGSVECGGSTRKRLMRTMRNLSLADCNWYTFLENLTAVGTGLVSVATDSFLSLLQSLRAVAANDAKDDRRGRKRSNSFMGASSSSSSSSSKDSSGDVDGQIAKAMSLPQIAAPSSVPEVRLLYVLKFMTVLRARGSEAASQEAEVVAQYMRRLAEIANLLWDALCDCLAIVRNLEGIFAETSEAAASASEQDHSSGSSSGSANSFARLLSHRKKEDSKKMKISDAESKMSPSALTLRFIPLIECYLIVSTTTLLTRPAAAGEGSSPGSGSGPSPGSAKRKVSAMGEEKEEQQQQQPPPTPMTFSMLPSPIPMSRTNSFGVGSTAVTLPGTRFRTGSDYQSMQMEFAEVNGENSRLLTFVEQNRVLLNMILRHNVQLLESSFSLLVSLPKVRQVLHFDIKRSYFKMKLKKKRISASRSAASSGSGSLRIAVHRQRVFEESFQALRYKTADEMRRKLSVTFSNEEGMDAGGLTREWYSVLAREVFNAGYVLFVTTGDGVTFQPNPNSYVNPDHLSYFKFVGRIIGKAICDGHLMDAHFTRSFYKHILGLSVNFHDLEAIEPDYYKSLKQLLDTPLELLGLDLTFTAETDNFGKLEVMDLVPNGRDIAVTDENKFEYVRLVAHNRMTTAIKKQIDAFLEGFHDLVPPELISIFDAQELELLISGLPDIDLDDLRAHTDYHGYKASDPEIAQFWSVLRSFSKEETALFLQFVTGTSKVPLDGFKALHGSDGIKKFNIHKAGGSQHLLPTAHTCFNQLDLPQYSSEEILREKLLIAIKEGSEGFGFA